MIYAKKKKIQESLNIVNSVSYPAIICFGRRRSGKSFIIQEFLNTLKNPIVLCFSKTAELTGSYKTAIIYNEFSPVILDAFMKKESKFEKIVVFDDIIETDTKYIKQLNNLFTMGRHYKTTVILATQYPSLLNPTIRGNSDFMYVLSGDGYHLISEKKYMNQHMIHKRPDQDIYFDLI